MEKEGRSCVTFGSSAAARPACVCLIGTGALGSEISRQLAMHANSTVPHSFTLIDPDRLEARNVPASLLFADAQQQGKRLLGLRKVEVVAAWCREKAPSISWRPFPGSVEEFGWQDLATHHLVMTATDSLSSRMFTAHACRLLGLPMLDAAVHGQGANTGRIAFFPAQESAACYSCSLTPATRSSVLRGMAEQGQGCATLPPTASMDDSPETSRALVNTAQQAVRLLQQLGRSLPETATVFQVGEDASQPFALRQSADCPWHEQRGSLRKIERSRLLAAQLASDEVFILPLPLADGFVCAACGAASQRMVLASRLSQVACAHCHSSGSLAPFGLLYRVGPDDPAGQCSPDALLLPQRHLLPVRKRIQRHWTKDTA